MKTERLKRERRRRLLLTVGAPVLVVVLIIAGFIVKATRTPAVATGSAATPAGTTLESALKNIPAPTFDTIGTGAGVGAPTKWSSS